MVLQEQFKKWYKSHFPEIEQEFFSFLRFRSISTDPVYKQETILTAKWLEQYLQKIGLKTELWETKGFPVLFASLESPGNKRPTLLLYHHYDVQPIDPASEWISPPFEPHVREGKIYARGAVDNKGQCFYSLTLIRAWMEMAQEKKINLKVFIEGEEESGSEGTASILEKYKDRLQADSMLVIDSGIPSLSSPAVTVGMRGLVSCEVECQNAFADLHSGEHGGIALNPNRVLAKLLAGLWDERGRVTLPHFYQDVEPISKGKLDNVDLSFDPQEYKKTFGVGALCNEEGYTARESNGLRPTLEINGMSGGYTGVGFKTIIPAKSSAKISCRLVAHQDPHKIFQSLERYFKEKAPQGIEIRVHSYSGAPAFCSDLESDVIRISQEAYEEVFGKKCQFLFCGASVPIIVKLSQVTGAQVATLGLGLATDAIHSPNEHFSWERFHLGYLLLGSIVSRFEALS